MFALEPIVGLMAYLKSKLCSVFPVASWHYCDYTMGGTCFQQEKSADKLNSWEAFQLFIRKLLLK
jgi:hypothetical protein